MMWVCALHSQSVSDPLKLELHVTASSLTCRTFNHRAISPAVCLLKEDYCIHHYPDGITGQLNLPDRKLFLDLVLI